MQIDKIIYSNRKTISLEIDKNNDIIVRTNKRTPINTINEFFEKHIDWLKKKLKERERRELNKRTFNFVPGEIVSILGKDYTIQFGNFSKIKLDESNILIPNNLCKEQFTNFIKRYAKKYLTERVEFISKSTGLNYKKLTVNSAKTVWGSCTYINNLNFTYRLMFCPIQVVDYVIVHELCHTKQKNHSAKFWALVEGFIPDWKIKRKWLKTNNYIMDIY